MEIARFFIFTLVTGKKERKRRKYEKGNQIQRANPE